MHSFSRVVQFFADDLNEAKLNINNLIKKIEEKKGALTPSSNTKTIAALDQDKLTAIKKWIKTKFIEEWDTVLLLLYLNIALLCNYIVCLDTKYTSDINHF